MRKAIREMPEGIAVLYLIQMFSTFAFAVLYSSLSLFLIEKLNLPQTISNSIVGLFFALNYAAQLFGGIIGGRFLSNRTVFLISLFIQTLGLWFLALINIFWLKLGLSLYVLGCGLSTTCYNSILTQRFTSEDTRRDTAFFYSYAAMNVGFLAGYIMSGCFDYFNQYRYLFNMGFGLNLITILLTLQSWRHFIDTKTPLAQDKNYVHRLASKIVGFLIVLLLIPLFGVCFGWAELSNVVVIAMSVILCGFILLLAKKQKAKSDEQKILAFLILAISSMIFWMVYFTAPMGITLFIKHNVNRHVGGYELPTQWIFNVNAIVIIFGAPILSSILSRLKRHGVEASVTNQFIFGFLFLALSFFSLIYGVMFANGNGFVGLLWVIMYFVFIGIAELLLGPVGYAMIGRIAPTQLQGFLMGSWMMVTGVSAPLSHYFSNAMTKISSTHPLLTNGDYLSVFKELSCYACLGAVCLYFISGKISHLINSPKKNSPEKFKPI
jgi:POT family proton-dependent oligopeptide transporter